jgi:hypothetical protein
VLVALAAGIVVVIVVLGVELPAREARQQGAIGRLKAAVGASPTGAEVDLGTAFDLPWDRAVLMPAYAGTEEMNARLGFDGYGAGANSGMDESTQFLVFVKDTTVVADTPLFADEDFKFESGIEEFSRDQAQFVVTRPAGSQQILLVRP